MPKINHDCEGSRCRNEGEICLCPACLDDVKTEAYNEGYAKGLEDGKSNN